MEEAEGLCDDLAIIDHGQIIAMGTLAELRAQLGERDLLRFSGSFEPERVRRRLAETDGAEVVTVETETLTLAVRDASKRLPALFAALAEAGAEIRETTLSQPSLEALFIKLTGKELRE
jgi:ABC-2 type transport system ATP-binding protein